MHLIRNEATRWSGGQTFYGKKYVDTAASPNLNSEAHCILEATVWCRRTDLNPI